jgi:uncharacterized protein YcbK (DUF882 family)
MGSANLHAPRRAVLGMIAGMFTVTAAPLYASAPGLLQGAGDVRRFQAKSSRSGEAVDVEYFADGDYIPDALSEISHFMRDLHRDEVREYDHDCIDILSVTTKLLDTSEPYLLLSGYRSPETNRRIRGAARRSFHMKAMAADIRLRSREARQISQAALSIGIGGVGTYVRSSFVHLDSGPTRSWRG